MKNSIILLCLTVLMLNLSNLLANTNDYNNALLKMVEKKLVENPTLEASEITILFAYTTSAAIAAGGPNKIKERIDDGLKELNSALDNHNFSYDIKAVAEYVEVEYGAASSESQVGSLLTELGKTNGKFNKIHQYRQEKKADLICLVFSGHTMGKADLNGYKMVSHYKTFGKSGGRVFSHEFGHVLGATHEGGYNVTLGGKSYRTISNNNGVAINYFSANKTGATITHNGTSYSGITLGDSNNDNIGTMKDNAPTKASLGNSLNSVPDAANAVAAKLVNPATAPMPSGSSSGPAISSCSATGGKTTFKLKYSASDAVSVKAILRAEGFEDYGVGGNLNPSKKEMDWDLRTNIFSGDKIIILLNDKEVTSCIAE